MGRDAVRLRREAARREVTADEIIAWCRDKLARYKCPRHVVFVDLPKTSTGKIQKFRLRELAKDV